MLNPKQEQFNEILEEIASSLDITPTKYKDAMNHYQSVKDHLQNGASNKPDIYLQGSFRLGTVIKPLMESKDAEYDKKIKTRF